MHRRLIRVLKVTGVVPAYVAAVLFVVPVAMLVNARATRSVFRFYRRGFAFGLWKSLWLTVRNHCCFAQAVVDKFAMYGGRRFVIEVDGIDTFRELECKPEGFMILSAHIGNYEIAGYTLVSEQKAMKAVVFAGEKESVTENRRRMFGVTNVDMIAIRPGASDHVYAIKGALDKGEIVSIPADRVFGSPRVFNLGFLKGKADFPQGPFVTAAALDVEAVVIAVMKTGLKRYKVYVRRISADTETEGRKRAAQLANCFAQELSSLIRQYPAQWYNYFDFLKYTDS